MGGKLLRSEGGLSGEDEVCGVPETEVLVRAHLLSLEVEGVCAAAKLVHWLVEELASQLSNPAAGEWGATHCFGGG